MKKIIISLSIIAVVAVVAVGATTAFFSDTETSTGNTFTAGSIDLKVDSECHYWNYTGDSADGGWTDVGCDGVGTWEESDLNEDGHLTYKFFDFGDLKPGDRGENTISLHVYDNDAWGRFEVKNIVDQDNTCTEPETEAEVNCANDTYGELDNHLLFSAWLDQGSIPGFQNGDPTEQIIDPEEGDNVWQDQYEPMFWRGELATADAWEISEILSLAYSMCNQSPYSPDGHNNYGYCHGLAEDGRMVGSTTYYFGLAWDLPMQTGNDVQTDSLSADMEFMVEQHRNNPNPFAPAL